MMPEPSFRSFKGGSWDLRRSERRQSQQPISFPDRRVWDRRAPSPTLRFLEPELTWMTKPGLDE